MHDATAGSEPLHIATTKSRCGAERIGVVDQAFAHDGDGLKTAVRMRRKARDRAAVVHAPAVLAGEILSDVASVQRRIGPQLRIAARIGVVVVDAEQERIDRGPLRTQSLGIQDRAGRHGRMGVSGCRPQVYDHLRGERVWLRSG